MAALGGAAAAAAARQTRKAAVVVGRQKRNITPADQLLAIVESCQNWVPPLPRKGWWARNRRNVAGVSIIFLWLHLAATFYKTHNGWTWSQSWFVSVDVFCAIGFGSLAEGVGDPTTSDFKPWTGSMAFTVVHTVMGGIMVSFFLAFVILYMVDMKEQLVNKSMQDNRKLSRFARLINWWKEHPELTFSVTLYLIWLGIGVVGCQIITDYNLLRSVYYSVTAMSTAGLQGPDPRIPAELNFTTIYSLFGVPVFALLLSVLSGLIVETIETQKIQERLQSPITEAEFNYVDEVMGKEEVDFGGFLILTLAKLGKMDDRLLTTIKTRFKFLDMDGDGAFSRAEMELMTEFERYDTDDSNALDCGEFALLLMHLNYKNPGSVNTEPVAILNNFRDIDFDGDNEIDKSEFLKWWRTAIIPTQDTGAPNGRGRAESSGTEGTSRTVDEYIKTPVPYQPASPAPHPSSSSSLKKKKPRMPSLRMNSINSVTFTFDTNMDHAANKPNSNNNYKGQKKHGSSNNHARRQSAPANRRNSSAVRPVAQAQWAVPTPREDGSNNNRRMTVPPHALLNGHGSSYANVKVRDEKMEMRKDRASRRELSNPSPPLHPDDDKTKKFHASMAL